jgi:two-component system response regulator FixJ
MMGNGMRKPTVFLVDDDADVRDSVRALLESADFYVQDYESAGRFLADYGAQPGCCLVADIRMPEMDGLELQEILIERNAGIPVIIMTGHGDVPLAVRAMKAGAVDFIEKPFDDERLLSSVQRALEVSAKAGSGAAPPNAVSDRIQLLTEREHEVLLLLIAGHANKVVAHMLGISSRTVEVHRGHIMEKMQARNLADLVRLALAAGLSLPGGGGG